MSNPVVPIIFSALDPAALPTVPDPAGNSVPVVNMSMIDDNFAALTSMFTTDTIFPISPQVGAVCVRTDLNEIYVYDGAIWVSNTATATTATTATTIGGFSASQLAKNVRTLEIKTASFTAGASNTIYITNGASVTATLPPMAPGINYLFYPYADGNSFVIDAGTDNILLPNGTGVNSYASWRNNHYLRIFCDGGHWYLSAPIKNIAPVGAVSGGATPLTVTTPSITAPANGRAMLRIDVGGNADFTSQGTTTATLPGLVIIATRYTWLNGFTTAYLPMTTGQSATFTHTTGSSAGNAGALATVSYEID